MEQELLTLPEHLSSPPVFSGVRVTRSLVLCVCFVDRCLSFCTFSFGHYVVCFSLIYGFWLPLWYLQTLLRQFDYIDKSIPRKIRFFCLFVFFGFFFLAFISLLLSQSWNLCPPFGRNGHLKYTDLFLNIQLQHFLKTFPVNCAGVDLKETWPFSAL